MALWSWCFAGLDQRCHLREALFVPVLSHASLLTTTILRAAAGAVTRCRWNLQHAHSTRSPPPLARLGLGAHSQARLSGLTLSLTSPQTGAPAPPRPAAF
jgi:hypothetical protein